MKRLVIVLLGLLFLVTEAYPQKYGIGYRIGRRNIVSTPPDTIKPVVTNFTIPETWSTLEVPITSFSGTDNKAVIGYIVTESSTTPSTGWSVSPPEEYIFLTEGAKTLYAWVRDLAGNISESASSGVTITIPLTYETFIVDIETGKSIIDIETGKSIIDIETNN